MSESDNISMPQESAEPIPYKALDERLYNLSDEERSFFKEQSGIQDDDELKAHIIQVQTEAYKVQPYPCIYAFNFARLRICRLSQYQDLLKIVKSRKDAIFLDVGSCFGNDTRKLVADGYPLEQVVTTDLHPEFGDLGHKLFRTTHETYPIAFVPGDLFDSKHLEAVPPVATAHAPTGPLEGPTPELCSLTSLNPLHGRVFATHASSIFHFFGEEKQLHLARALAGLLSPEPGSVIFGRHVGNHERGFIIPPGLGDRQMFCHSPESWTELWDGLVFEKGVVTVQVTLEQVETKGGTIAGLVWSVTRL